MLHVTRRHLIKIVTAPRLEESCGRKVLPTHTGRSVPSVRVRRSFTIAWSWRKMRMMILLTIVIVQPNTAIVLKTIVRAATQYRCQGLRQFRAHRRLPRVTLLVQLFSEPEQVVGPERPVIQIEGSVG